MNLPASNSKIKPLINTWKRGQHHFGDIQRRLGMEIHEQRWLIEWLAYLLQNPGAKMPKAVFFHTPADNKNLDLLITMIRVTFGSKARAVTEHQLINPFNAWVNNKTLAIINLESWSVDASPVKPVLKQLISNDQIEIQRKARNPHTIKNTLNFILISDHEELYDETASSERRFQYFRCKKTDYTVNFSIAKAIAEFREYLLNYDLTRFHLNSIPVSDAGEVA